MSKKLKNNTLKIIKNIEKARSKNNVNWMNILRLAMRYSPKETKKILKNINSQDEKFQIYLKKLKNKYFFLSRVKAADLNLIFELSNQKTVRKWSFNKSKIDYEKS